MAAYLSSHPSITMSNAKEVHFFDVDTKWKKGADYYDGMWPLPKGHSQSSSNAALTAKPNIVSPVPVPVSASPGRALDASKSDASKSSHLIYGVRAEATPYYIASAKACGRIAETMTSAADDFRLVLMVREPVARLWSEYMMEMRRIDDDLDGKAQLEGSPKEVSGALLLVLRQPKRFLTAHGLRLQLFPDFPKNAAVVSRAS